MRSGPTAQHWCSHTSLGKQASATIHKTACGGRIRFGCRPKTAPQWPFMCSSRPSWMRFPASGRLRCTPHRYVHRWYPACGVSTPTALDRRSTVVQNLLYRGIGRVSQRCVQLTAATDMAGQCTPAACRLVMHIIIIISPSPTGSFFTQLRAAHQFATWPWSRETVPPDDIGFLHIPDDIYR